MIVQYTTWERRFISTLLQFAILSVLTEPVMKAHLHVHVMRGLKEMTAIHQVCQIQTYTLYCTYVCMHVQHIHMYHTTYTQTCAMGCCMQWTKVIVPFSSLRSCQDTTNLCLGVDKIYRACI